MHIGRFSFFDYHRGLWIGMKLFLGPQVNWTLLFLQATLTLRNSKC